MAEPRSSLLRPHLVSRHFLIPLPAQLYLKTEFTPSVATAKTSLALSPHLLLRQPFRQTGLAAVREAAPSGVPVSLRDPEPHQGPTSLTG